jgi:RNA polymerase sigma-70 factor (ECF subfamily)
MSADEFQTSTTLLGRLRDYQDASAWQRFLGRYQPLILGWCHRAGLQADDAAEVAGAVLLKVVAALGKSQYDPQRRFRPWLKTVVDNAVRDLYRARGRRPGDRGQGGEAGAEALERLAAPGSVGALVEELDGELEGERQRLHQAMERARARVEPHTWSAFWQTAVEGRPGAAVAADLGLKVASVHMAKSRVVKLLREEVARDQPGGAEGPDE